MSRMNSVDLNLTSMDTVTRGESLRQWVLRLLATEPGQMAHRHDLGVGAPALLGTPTVNATQQLANAIRRQVIADERVRDCTVTAASNHAQVAITLSILTTDDETLAISTTLPVGT